MLSLSLTPSTALTLIRLLGGCFLMPTLLWVGLPQQRQSINVMLTIIFGLLGFTDFLDGYLARRFSQETELGKILDPLADKVLVFSTLIALIATGKIHIMTGIIIIGRELFVMGLRTHAWKAYGTYIPVATSGKIKTIFQFAYLSMAILNNYHDLPLYIPLAEYFLLTGTIFFTIHSAILYYQAYSVMLSLAQ